MKSGDKPANTISKVFQDALADDIESHRVMYQYMFVENKNKKSELVQKMNAEEGEVKDASCGPRSDV